MYLIIFTKLITSNNLSTASISFLYTERTNVFMLNSTHYWHTDTLCFNSHWKQSFCGRHTCHKHTKSMYKETEGYRNMVRETKANKLCGRPPQYASATLPPARWPLTIKMVSESRVTWATSVPTLVFLGLSVLNLGPMYTTDW